MNADHLCQYSHRSDFVSLAPVCVDYKADGQATVKGVGLQAWLPPHARSAGLPQPEQFIGCSTPSLLGSQRQRLTIGQGVVG